jgi:hypothetical protein
MSDTTVEIQADVYRLKEFGGAYDKLMVTSCPSSSPQLEHSGSE